MKVKTRDVLILLLIGLVATLAVGVVHKSDRTEVNTQTIEPIPGAGSAPSSGPASTLPTSVFIGDFTDGSNEGGEGERNWTALVGRKINETMPVRVVADSSGGGSGYVVRGSSLTFPDQVRRLVTSDARVVVISGSRSDVVAEPTVVTAAALETFALVHNLAPRASLIVIGPTWGTSEPTEALLRTRDAVRDAAVASAAYFVDPIEDAWFTNGDPGLIGSDSVHPTDAGNERIADLMAPLVAAGLTQVN